VIVWCFLIILQKTDSKTTEIDQTIDILKLFNEKELPVDEASIK
jgi:hypothetical protein